MPVDVALELRRLAKMPMADLRARYEEVFGEGTRSKNREHLVKRIVELGYELQRQRLVIRRRRVIERELGERKFLGRQLGDEFRLQFGY